MKHELETPPEPPRTRPSQGGGGQWLIPASLLLLFIGTAAATLFVKDESFEDRNEAAPDVGAEPAQGGVFRYPLLGGRGSPLVETIHTLDPAQAVYSTDVMLVQQIYDGLTAFDKNLNVVPALAKFWEISPDGRTYTFELRDDVRFHNGREVTADDCVFSFERLLTKGLNEHNYHYFSRIEGAADFREGRARRVSGLQAVDESTFRIRFETPFVPALSVLSMYSSKILPREEVESQGKVFFDAPIGTGAFQFARWVEPPEDPAVPTVNGVTQGLRLEANPNYFEGRAHLDAIVFRSLGNARGYGPPPPLHDIADCLRTNELERYSDWVPVESDRLLALRYLHFPPSLEAYQDARVRRAINLALDKRSFLDAQRVTAGIPEAYGIVPPGIPGFVPKESASTRDLAAARRLLVEAGYPGGKGLPPLELPVFGSVDKTRDPRECLIACLAEIGVEVKPVPVDWLTGRRSRAALSDDTWYADFPDPDNFLRPLFHSSGYMNDFGYHNPEVDRLLDQVWTETSYTKRNTLYHRIEELILEDSPVIPTDYGRLRYLLRPNVRGFFLTPLGAPYIKMKDIWLAQEGPVTEVEL